MIARTPAPPPAKPVTADPRAGAIGAEVAR